MLVIETPRLILRNLAWDDLDAMSKIFADPVVMKYYPKTYTYEESKQWLEKAINTSNQRGWGLLATIHKNDNKFIGRCGIIPQVVDEQQEIEVGYMLAKEYWGQGLATEAAIACRNYAFEKLGCNRLISLIDPGNIASQKVAIKNGMQYEKSAQMWNRTVSVYSINQSK